MQHFLRWWQGLSGEAKAAIIAAIVGPITSEVIGLRPRMIRWLYIHTLMQLDKARIEVNRRKLGIASWPERNIIEVSEEELNHEVPIEVLAREAHVWLWLAKRATEWHQRVKKYGV